MDIYLRTAQALLCRSTRKQVMMSIKTSGNPSLSLGEKVLLRQLPLPRPLDTPLLVYPIEIAISSA